MLSQGKLEQVIFKIKTEGLSNGILVFNTMGGSAHDALKIGKILLSEKRNSLHNVDDLNDYLEIIHWIKDLNDFENTDEFNSVILDEWHQLDTDNRIFLTEALKTVIDKTLHEHLTSLNKLSALGNIDYNLGLLCLVSSKKPSEKENIVLLNQETEKEFEDFLRTIKANTEILKGQEIIFITSGPHWKAGIVKVSQDGNISIFIADSIGTEIREEKLFIASAHELRNIRSILGKKANVIISDFKRQRDYVACQVFSLDDAIHFRKSEPYLPEDDGNAQTLFSYLESHLKETEYYLNPDTHPLSERAMLAEKTEDITYPFRRGIPIQLTKMPIYLMRTTQSSYIKNDVFFDQYSAKEKAKPLTKKQYSPKTATSLHFNQTTNRNERVEHKLLRFQKKTFNLLKSYSFDEIEKMKHPFKLSSFKKSLTKKESINAFTIDNIRNAMSSRTPLSKNEALSKIINSALLSESKTLIDIIVDYSKEYDRLEEIRILIRNCHSYINGYSSLGTIISQIENNELPPNIRNQKEETPLHAAAKIPSSIYFNTLLELGCDSSLLTSIDNSAAIIAATYNHIQAIELLLTKKNNINQQNWFGETALTVASEKGNSEICQLLLSDSTIDETISNDLGETALHKAALQGHYQICSMLIRHPVDVNKLTSSGETPLILASKKGYLNICRLLIMNHAEINSHTPNSPNALFTAIEHSHPDIAMYLIMNGADLTIKSSHFKNMTPLMFALEKGMDELCIEIINRGGMTEDHYPDKSTLLLKSIQLKKYHITELLMKNGANVDVIAWGRTPLMQAAIHCDLRTCQLLMHTINTYSLNGTTALMEAARSDPNASIICTTLIAAGAEVNVQNKSGSTALIEAAWAGYSSVCKTLIENGADLEIKNKKGMTALMLAADSYLSSSTETCLVLLQHGALINTNNQHLLDALRRRNNPEINHFVEKQIMLNHLKNQMLTVMHHVMPPHQSGSRKTLTRSYSSDLATFSTTDIEKISSQRKFSDLLTQWDALTKGRYDARLESSLLEQARKEAQTPPKEKPGSFRAQ